MKIPIGLEHAGSAARLQPRFQGPAETGDERREEQHQRDLGEDGYGFVPSSAHSKQQQQDQRDEDIRQIQMNAAGLDPAHPCGDRKDGLAQRTVEMRLEGGLDLGFEVNRRGVVGETLRTPPGSPGAAGTAPRKSSAAAWKKRSPCTRSPRSSQAVRSPRWGR